MAPYVDALERLKATYIETTMHDGLPEDMIELIERSPKELFENYLDRMKNSPVDMTQLWTFLAWLNGGAPGADVAGIPENIHSFFFDSFASQAPELVEVLGRPLASELAERFETVVSKAQLHGNDYRANWDRLGANKAGFSQTSEPQQLMKIWEIVKDRVSDASPNAYYGFDWYQNGVSCQAPQLLGIVACCGVLDALGFHAEKKRRKIEKQANVQSDAQHIAMASFCDVLFTQDERMYRRAKAIYEYRKIRTKVFYLDNDNEPHA